MKKPAGKILIVAASALAMSWDRPVLAEAPGAAPALAEPPSASPTADEAGYTYGVNFGEQLNRLGITDQIPLEALMRGFKDGLSGARKTQQGDLQLVERYVRSVQAGIIARNHAAAKEFLERNATAAGVHTTPSGLEYKVLSQGDLKAASPQTTDTVTVQYRGKLLDGAEFDSSYTRGKPTSFPLNGVIKGWQEALPLMKPGAKWQLFVPPELGYDATVRPGIPLGSLLIFDVELLSVGTPGKASATPASETSSRPPS